MNEYSFESVRQVPYRSKKISCLSLKAKNKCIGSCSLINFTTSDLWLKNTAMMAFTSFTWPLKKTSQNERNINYQFTLFSFVIKMSWNKIKKTFMTIFLLNENAQVQFNYGSSNMICRHLWFPLKILHTSKHFGLLCLIWIKNRKWNTRIMWNRWRYFKNSKQIFVAPTLDV